MVILPTCPCCASSPCLMWHDSDTAPDEIVIDVTGSGDQYYEGVFWYWQKTFPRPPHPMFVASAGFNVSGTYHLRPGAVTAFPTNTWPFASKPAGHPLNYSHVDKALYLGMEAKPNFDSFPILNELVLHVALPARAYVFTDRFASPQADLVSDDWLTIANTPPTRPVAWSADKFALQSLCLPPEGQKAYTLKGERFGGSGRNEASHRTGSFDSGCSLPITVSTTIFHTFAVSTIMDREMVSNTFPGYREYMEGGTLKMEFSYTMTATITAVRFVRGTTTTDVWNTAGQAGCVGYTG